MARRWEAMRDLSHDASDRFGRRQNMHHLAISRDARLRTTTLQRNYSEPQASTIRCICACGNWKPNISPRRPTIRSCVMYVSDRGTVLPDPKRCRPSVTSTIHFLYRVDKRVYLRPTQRTICYLIYYRICCNYALYLDYAMCDCHNVPN